MVASSSPGLSSPPPKKRVDFMTLKMKVSQPYKMSVTVTSLRNTGLFKMIVRVLTTCHTQYT